MSPAQIAGLSVAAVAAFAMAIGLMALSVCLRKRRERKDAFKSDEKNSGRKSKKYSSRFSHYVPVGSQPEPPNQFPMALPLVARKGGERFSLRTNPTHAHPMAPYPNRAVQRNGVGTSNSSSSSSLPLEQIGMAISAELDGTSVAPRANTNANSQPQQTKNNRSSLNVPFRPISTMTQETTVDASDPTPDDEDDDKQLSDENQLSPVAESPISNLRYPKVPRASNQLVPRSPRSPQHFNGLHSPIRNQPTPPRRNQPSPPTSHLLQHRRKDLAPPLLESRLPLRLNAPKDIALVPQPLKEPFTSPPRVRHARTHMRSNSTESWSTTPLSKVDRKSRTQSGMWPRSPAMYDEPDMIKPLNVKRKEESLSVRRHRDEMREINVGRDIDYDAEMNGMKSPVWVPRLTPTRKGDDLFISVGWGGR
ncbi:hypothetical protein GQ44DRAFT_615027 [Phaeosphaeriaceae sp. PMI808]|nr:hypothetical protein GQ44DRAFT_615027 [Phaeosphaeriaceae sp. PMI808]